MTVIITVKGVKYGIF